MEALATLNQGELDRLAQITADLAGDPARAARQLAALRTKIDNQVASLDRLFSALAPANAERLRQLATAREAAREAAIAASGALFRDEPLPAIGGDAWRGLWESARTYSEQEAYPGQPFPAIEPGDVCVLCQQELAPEAADRLGRFEAFVRDDSQQRAEATRVAHEDAVTTFRWLAANAAGAFIGGIVLESRNLLRASPRSAIIITILWCFSVLGFAVANSYALALVMMLVAGFLNLTSGAMAQTLVQLESPAHLRGRLIEGIEPAWYRDHLVERYSAVFAGGDMSRKSSTSPITNTTAAARTTPNTSFDDATI